MLRLRPFLPGDARTVAGWLESEHALRQWSADRYRSFPLTAEDMDAYYRREQASGRCWAMTAFDEAGIAGHFTLRYPRAEGLEELRLGFVILDPRRRGRGLGRELVTLAARYALDLAGAERVSLGVFANNSAAIRCYRACGFREVPREEPERYCCMGEVWDCIEMELTGTGAKEDLL